MTGFAWTRRSYNSQLVTAFVVIFVILLAGLYLGPPRICVHAKVGADVERVDLVCARFTDLSEDEQVATACVPLLSGSCTTSPGVCMALAFVGNVTSAVLESGYTGEAYRCGNTDCVEVGRLCSCHQPFVRGATHFCRRLNHTLPCS